MKNIYANTEQSHYIEQNKYFSEWLHSSPETLEYCLSIWRQSEKQLPTIYSQTERNRMHHSVTYKIVVRS